jgi:hypothetical protein
VEQGVESNHPLIHTIKEEELLLPTLFANETTMECHRYIFMLTCSLSHVHQHLLRVSSTRHDELEENMALLQLNMTIEHTMMHLPPHFGDESSHVLTRLLHMMYHLNIMLLHHYYYINPLPQESSYNHRQLCLSSATSMVRLVEGLLPLGQYRYVPRGLSWVTYCIATTLRVLDMERKLDISYMDAYQQCHHLAQCVLLPQDTGKKRRNTIPYRGGLLQSSSVDINQFSIPHRGLNRNMTVSCQDLRQPPSSYQPSKVRRLKKSQSIHGLSNNNSRTSSYHD